MKKISIASFGGNKDCYYNYKRCVESALKSAREASRYTSPSDLPDQCVQSAITELSDIEFED